MPVISELKERLRKMNLLHGEEQPSDLTSSIALLRDTVIFFAVIFYFVGWIYLNEYLRPFGIYLANLNVPLHYVFVFSYAPLLDPFYDWSWLRIFKFLVLVLFIFISVVAYKSRRAVGYTVAILFSLFIIGLSFNIAREIGEKHADDILKHKGGKPIRFVFDPKTMTNLDDAIVSDLQWTNSQKPPCLRLVWKTNEEIYAVDVCQNRKDTYRIPISAFTFSKTYGSDPDELSSEE